VPIGRIYKDWNRGENHGVQMLLCFSFIKFDGGESHQGNTREEKEREKEH